MKNKTIIVTGATGGIGAELTRVLSGSGNTIIMACKDLDKAHKVKSELNKDNIQIIELDLASFDSISNFIDTIKRDRIHPDILINNAGVMCKQYSTTSQSIERTIGVNYMGTFLLTILLIPYMNKDNSAIISTTSLTRMIGKINTGFLNLEEKSFNRFKAYSASKLAIYLMTEKLASILKDENISVNVIDPGIVNTNMISMQEWYDPIADICFRPFIKGVKKGVIPTLKAVESCEYTSGFLFVGNKKRKIILNTEYKKYQEVLINETLEYIISFYPQYQDIKIIFE